MLSLIHPLSLLCIIGWIESAVVHQDPYHTCDTDEECVRRFSPIYPEFEFVCCSTIVCGYENPYYLVSSGCSTTLECSQILFNKTTRLAARLHKLSWDRIEGGVNLKCDKTASAIRRLPNTTVSASEGNAEFLQKTTKHVIKRRKAVSKTREDCALECGQGEECCTTVECAIGLEKTGEYVLEQRCARVCPTTSFAAGHHSHYQFGSSQWASRRDYERTSRSDSVVEKNCKETRHFFHWLINSGRIPNN